MEKKRRGPKDSKQVLVGLKTIVQYCMQQRTMEQTKITPQGMQQHLVEAVQNIPYERISMRVEENLTSRAYRKSRDSSA